MNRTYKKHKPTGGKAIVKSARPVLEAGGWVVVDFEHHAKMPKGAIGFPDLQVFRFGVTWLIEVKAPGDELRPSQIKFFCRIYHHLGRTLRYMIAESADDLIEIVTGSPAIIQVPHKFLKALGLEEVNYEPE